MGCWVEEEVNSAVMDGAARAFSWWGGVEQAVSHAGSGFTVHKLQPRREAVAENPQHPPKHQPPMAIHQLKWLPANISLSTGNNGCCQVEQHMITG